MADLHLISENDELSERNGSAILTVTRGLQAAAKAVGRQAWIGGGSGRLVNLADAIEVFEINSPWAKKLPLLSDLDGAAKYLLGRSPLAARLRPSTLPNVENVYCHNQPWISNSVRGTFPQAKVHLYVHNKVLVGAPARVVRKVLRKFDTVISVSDFISQDLQTRAAYSSYHSDRPTFRSVFNGVDASRFGGDQEDHDPVDVVYVGRVVRDKGTHVLARAMVKVAESQQCSLRIVGGAGFLPTEAVSKYEAQVLELLRTGGVNFETTGPVAPQQVPGLVNTAKIMVVPSVWDEPCGLVLLEGLASRAAVIASDVGGMPEIGNQSGARFVAADDEDALAAAIRTLLNDSRQRSLVAQQGQSWAKSRDWATVYSELHRASC